MYTIKPIGKYIKSAFYFPVYFILFCIYVIFTLIELHRDYFSLSDTTLALLIIPPFSLVLFAVLRLLLSNVHLAGLATLIALIALTPAVIEIAPLYALGALTGIGLILFRIPRHGMERALELPRNFTVVFNVVAIVAVATVIGNVVLNAMSIRQTADSLLSADAAGDETASALAAPDPLPHIVHIVLDGYSRSDVLAELYGYDNTPFLDALRDRGFRVSDRATVPYTQTLFVMASTFSMAPITKIATQQSQSHAHRNFRGALSVVHREGRVMQVLEELGYEIRSSPVSYPPVEWDTAGEDLGDNGWTPYRLGRSHFLQGILSGSPMLGRASPWMGRYGSHAAINYEAVMRVPERRFEPSTEQPLFVYQHVIAPHPPFNVRADGTPMEIPDFPPTISDGSHLIENDEEKRAKYREGYIEKLRFINDAMLQQIDGLIVTLPEPRIIILHSDHGSGLYMDYESAENTCLKERFGVLFAVHATDETMLRKFHDDFNVVNTYRAIFRSLLEMDLPDLPSRHVFVPWSLRAPTKIHADMLERSCAPAIRDNIATRRD